MKVYILNQISCYTDKEESTSDVRLIDTKLSTSKDDILELQKKLYIEVLKSNLIEEAEIYSEEEDADFSSLSIDDLKDILEDEIEIEENKYYNFIFINDYFNFEIRFEIVEKELN